MQLLQRRRHVVELDGSDRVVLLGDLVGDGGVASPRGRVEQVLVESLLLEVLGCNSAHEAALSIR